MKLREYRKKFSGAPMSLEEFAECAVLIADDFYLPYKAQAYLEAGVEFAMALAGAEVEVG